ncbi:MAG: hypothetical protein QXE68_07245 [Sulfolobales archaeon]
MGFMDFSNALERGDWISAFKIASEDFSKGVDRELWSRLLSDPQSYKMFEEAVKIGVTLYLYEKVKSNDYSYSSLSEFLSLLKPFSGMFSWVGEVEKFLSTVASFKDSRDYYAVLSFFSEKSKSIPQGLSDDVWNVIYGYANGWILSNNKGLNYVVESMEAFKEASEKKDYAKAVEVLVSLLSAIPLEEFRKIVSLSDDDLKELMFYADAVKKYGIPLDRLVKALEFVSELVDLLKSEKFADAFSKSLSIEDPEAVDIALRESNFKVGDEFVTSKTLPSYILLVWFSTLLERKGVSKDEKVGVDKALEVLGEIAKSINRDLSYVVDLVSVFESDLKDIYSSYSSLKDFIEELNKSPVDWEKVFNILNEKIKLYGSYDAFISALSKFVRDAGSIVLTAEVGYIFSIAGKLKSSNVRSRSGREIPEDVSGYYLAVEKYLSETPLPPLSDILRRIRDGINGRDVNAVLSAVSSAPKDLHEALSYLSAVMSLDLDVVSDAEFLEKLYKSLGFEAQAKDVEEILEIKPFIIYLNSGDYVSAFKELKSYDSRKIELLKKYLKDSYNDVVAGVVFGYFIRSLPENASWKDVAVALDKAIKEIAVIRGSPYKGEEGWIPSEAFKSVPLALALVDLLNVVESANSTGSLSYDALRSVLDRLPENLRPSALAYALYNASSAVKVSDVPVLLDLFQKYGLGKESDFLMFIASLDPDKFYKFYVDYILSEIKDAWSSIESNPEKIKELKDRFGEVLKDLVFDLDIGGEKVTVNLYNIDGYYQDFKKLYPVIESLQVLMRDVFDDFEKLRSGGSVDDVFSVREKSPVDYSAVFSAVKFLRDNRASLLSLAGFLSIIGDEKNAGYVATVASNLDLLEDYAKLHMGFSLLRKRDEKAVDVFKDLAVNGRDQSMRDMASELAVTSMIMVKGIPPGDVDCILSKAGIPVSGSAPPSREDKGKRAL